MATATDKLAKDIMEEIVPLIFDTHRVVVENTPVDTGRLRASIQVEKVNDSEYIIGTNVEYAEAVELGTEPHIILPVNKKALKFNIGGTDIFAKRVNHPGTEGSHMFLKGVNFFESQINSIS